MKGFSSVIALVLTVSSLTSHHVTCLPPRAASKLNVNPGRSLHNGSTVPNFTEPKLRLDRVVCNYDASAENRVGDANFTIQQLDVKHCTDLYYDYARLDSIPVKSELPSNFLNWPFYSSEPTPKYATLNDHKLVKPNLVSFVTVGEGDADDLHNVSDGEKARPGVLPGLTFRMLVEREELLSTFSTWVVYLLRLWSFDGLALRWPADTGPGLLHKLLRVLRSRFTEEVRHARRSGAVWRDSLKLAVLLNTNRGDWLRVYDMQAMSKLADQITLEAVPEAQSVNETMVTRINQPLFRKNDVSTPRSSVHLLTSDERLTIDEAVQLVVNAGVARAKVNVAISLAGREFRLKNATQHGIGASVKNLASPSQIFFYEVCSVVNNATLLRASSNDTSPYVVRGERWISFEDTESIAQKVDYLKTARIGGVALFSQSADDFSGRFCGQGKFPLSSEAFLDADVKVDSLLMLPWQRYCSGQKRPQPVSAIFFVPTVGLLHGLIVYPW